MADGSRVREAWPPDYTQVFLERQSRLAKLRANLAGALAYYSTRPEEWIAHWAMTYDPRNAGSDVPAWLPFIPFQRQRELVQFLMACLVGQASGLIEKSRDMGATWIACAFSVWLWLFWDGASIGWGSRKEQLVDKIGDADSIFEKMRRLIMGLPREFWPAGFSPADHMTYMKIINPANGAAITGEAGDNIGRGGRKLIYLKDESAHYPRPELIEAALSDNTRVQIDISSVNGIGNVFHRRREAGIEWVPGAPVSRIQANVFVLDWRDHPAKSKAWYDERRQKAINDGLQHIFAQEVDRNYAAAVEGVIIQPDWVKAAIDAHKVLRFEDDGLWGGALDVADEGGDRNALALRKGPVIKLVEEWGERDTAHTARRAVSLCAPHVPLALQYDSVGVGAGVKAETNRLAAEGILPKGLKLVPWNGGASVQFPEQRIIPDDQSSPLNNDFYYNLKAQGWWELRNRFYRTYLAVTEGLQFDPADLISLPSDLPKLRQIEKELSQPTASKDNARLKLMVNKKPDGARSPNTGDAIMMMFWPIQLYEPPAPVFGTWGGTRR